MASTLVLGALIYFGGWLAHDSRTIPGGRREGWIGAPPWLSNVLRRGRGRLIAFPLLLQVVGATLVLRSLAVSGALPADPFDPLTRTAVTAAIFGAGAAALWLLWRDRSSAGH